MHTPKVKPCLGGPVQPGWRRGVRRKQEMVSEIRDCGGHMAQFCDGCLWGLTFFFFE